MGTISNSSLSNLLVLAALSSTVICLPYESYSLIPEVRYSYQYHVNIADWKDTAFNLSADYKIQDENSSKIETIVAFSKKIIGNSIDIDSEFVDIVNDNFWDLI